MLDHLLINQVRRGAGLSLTLNPNRDPTRFTAELAGRLFQALQAHLMALPPESRRETLDKAMLEMVGQKKRLEAERAFLSDQLTQVINTIP